MHSGRGRVFYFACRESVGKAFLALIPVCQDRITFHRLELAGRRGGVGEGVSLKSFMCVHLVWLGVESRKGGGGFPSRVKFPFHGYYHACVVGRF